MRYPRAEALYRLLLKAYPAEFRRDYGLEMEDAFRTQLRHEVRLHGRVRWTWVWAMALWDTGANGVPSGGSPRARGPARRGHSRRTTTGSLGRGVR